MDDVVHMFTKFHIHMISAALESVMLGGAKGILECSSRTCNEAVRGDMGLDTLQGHRDRNNESCGII